MRIHQILEARRNPEVNKKTSALSELQKYAGQEDVFVSFTDDVGVYSHPYNPYYTGKKYPNNITGSKLGINPKTNHNTPLGIYGYPIDHVLKKHGKVEYASNRPYIWVFRIKDMTSILDVSEYSESDYKTDLEKLKSYYKISKPVMLKSFKKIVIGAEKDAQFKTPAGMFWNVTRILSQTYEPFTPTRWTNLLRSIGYSGVIDNGNKIIHGNEPTQGVFFGKNTIIPLEVIRNINPASPKSIEQIIMDNPNHSIESYIKSGKLSDEVLLNLINKNVKMLNRRIFPLLPDHLKNIIKKDILRYFYNGISLSFFGFSPEETLEIAKQKHQPIDRADMLWVINSISDEVEKEKAAYVFIKTDPFFIKHLKNPSENLLITAIKEDVHVFQFIENPSERVQSVAISIDPSVVNYIENPSQKIQMQIVATNPRFIREIENPSEETQLYAVSRNGLNIKYIQNPTEKVKLEAIKENPEAIYYIADQSEEQQLLAISLDINAIREIEKPTEKVQLFAIEKAKEHNIDILYFIKNKSPKVQKMYDKRIKEIGKTITSNKKSFKINNDNLI